MEGEIREQPGLLARASATYFSSLRRSLEGCRPEVVVLAARGSSDNAALYARYLIEVHLQIPAVLASPSVWTKFGKRVKYPPCLAIGISQSGAAPDVAEVLGALREDGHATLGITNTPGSRLTDAAENTLLLECGEERAVAATKTYSASLLALYQTVRALGADDLPDPTAHLPGDGWIESARAQAESSCGILLRSQPLFALARGYDFSTANETALKLMECALLPCKSYSSADFQHGPKALAGPNSAAILFGESMPDLAAQGCTLVEAPKAADVPAVLMPVWNVVFSQWLALTASRYRGLDADDPKFIQKVTETL